MHTALLACWLTLGLAVPVAFGKGPVNLVRVEVSDAEIPAGGTASVEVAFRIPGGFHVYADRVAVEVLDAAGLGAGTPDLPPGLVRPDLLVPGTTREVYEGDAIVLVPVTASAGSEGARELKLRAEFQACTTQPGGGGFCFPPVEELLAARVRIAAAGIGVGPALAQDVESEKAVVFSPGPPKPGHAVVHVDLQGDWHLNKMFMGVTVNAKSPAGYTLGEPALPAAHPSGKVEDGTFREDFTEDFDLVVPVSGPAGNVELALDVAYQACKGISLCRMPTSETVSVPVEVGGAAAAASEPVATAPAEAPAATVAAATVPAAAGAFAEAEAQGVLSLLLLCFLAGVGVSFTPCVLPMVPITMGLIGARGAGSRFQAVSLAGAYVVGQALVYTALGVFAGVTGMLFGGALQSPWVIGGIATFFVVMGAGMFGFFDLQVPGAIQSRISGFQGRGGYGVAFVFGTIGAVLAGPCSGPVVFSILGVIAAQGQVAFGALLMFSFALGMGMIFLVTGAATGWLPARGAWMTTVKKSFGIVMWLGAIFYAQPLLTNVQTALLTAAVLLTTAVFAWPHPDDGEGFVTTRARQLYTVVGGIVGAYLLLGTLVTQGFILPPLRLSAAGTAAAGPAIPWLRDEASAVAAAQASGKLMVIDFTAEWCQACHELEKYTYTDPAVIAEAEHFVPAMLDCTRSDDPAIKAVQQKYGVTGLPTVVFARADGTIVNVVVGFVPAPEFLAEMKKARGA